jgi:RND superfamily putative drug exporter
MGWQQQSHVTYDLLAGLDEGRPSRQGTDLLREHYPVGESGPIVVLATLPDSPVEWTKEGPTPELLEATGKLAIELEAIDGVDYARSIEAPLGHRGRSGGPTQQVVRALPQVRALFFSLPNQSSVRATNTTQPVSIENPSSGVLRLDLVLKEDVFSIAATQTVDRVLAHTRRLKETPNSIWSQAQFSVAGTTAAVRDLREVTISDSQRVELLVVIAVYVVLVLILKHPLTCAYMILSVVFSYLVTVGLSDWVFEWSYGENYHGLEWKVPLFLFVILVAVGEDYNVYLASRVFEEQARIGQFAGLRRAIGKNRWDHQ